MTRSRAKGVRLERIARRHLEGEGYVVLRGADSHGPSISSHSGPKLQESRAHRTRPGIWGLFGLASFGLGFAYTYRSSGHRWEDVVRARLPRE